MKLIVHIVFYFPNAWEKVASKRFLEKKLLKQILKKAFWGEKLKKKMKLWCPNNSPPESKIVPEKCLQLHTKHLEKAYFNKNQHKICYFFKFVFC